MSEILQAGYALTNVKELEARGVRVELLHPQEGEGPAFVRLRLLAKELFITNPREFRLKVETWIRTANAESEGQ